MGFYFLRNIALPVAHIVTCTNSWNFTQLHKARAETLNTARHHGRAAHQFPAPDAESAEEAIGDTSPGTNIYIYVIYCMILIEYSS
jgi:hypothetical protein